MGLVYVRVNKLLVICSYLLMIKPQIRPAKQNEKALLLYIAYFAKYGWGALL